MFRPGGSLISLPEMLERFGEGTTEIRRHPSAARAFKALVSEETSLVPFCPDASSESVRTAYSYCVGRVGEQA